MLLYAIFFAAANAYLIFVSKHGIKAPFASGKFGPLTTAQCQLRHLTADADITD